MNLYNWFHLYRNWTTKPKVEEGNKETRGRQRCREHAGETLSRPTYLTVGLRRIKHRVYAMEDERKRKKYQNSDSVKDIRLSHCYFFSERKNI